jgi:hypothetical protein
MALAASVDAWVDQSDQTMQCTRFVVGAATERYFARQAASWSV